jgi:Heterokaryon incompatibility protein (HET)
VSREGLGGGWLRSDIDSVCMNQKNVSERNQQVSIMNGIYARAAQVVVWLGECSASRELAIDTIEEFGCNIKLHWIPPTGPVLSISTQATQTLRKITLSL